MKRPPRSLGPLFWEVGFARIDVERHADFTFARVLESGRSDDARWEDPRACGEAVRGRERRQRLGRYVEDRARSGSWTLPYPPLEMPLPGPQRARRFLADRPRRDEPFGDSTTG
jgi:hypothetical protein